jgi:hypothetical protein
MTAFARGLKRDMGDAFDFKAVIDLGIKRFLMLTAAFAAFRLAEVDAAGQFADAQNVEAVGGDIRAQRAELFQPWYSFAGRRLLNSLKCLRSGSSAPRSGCSAGGRCSHFGPPTEPTGSHRHFRSLLRSPAAAGCPDGR